ncbi:MAG: Tn3 family transposase [Richelia sp.]|nr:Tn3 family transposase [Richelia sp.]
MDLKTGDACVAGSESYADFREQLLSQSHCEALIEEYCSTVGFPSNPEGFVKYLCQHLTEVAEKVDNICAQDKQVKINQNGEIVLTRVPSTSQPKEVEDLENKIRGFMPERSILDILCNVEDCLNWTRHFGPLSGSEPKFKQSAERYIFTIFSYGCNLGPNQMAPHSRDVVTSLE